MRRGLGKYWPVGYKGLDSLIIKEPKAERERALPNEYLPLLIYRGEGEWGLG